MIHLELIANLLVAGLTVAVPVTDDGPSSVGLGGGTTGSRGVPKLSYEGAPAVGKPFRLRLSGARSNAHGCVGLSLFEQALPIPFFGATVHPAFPLFGLELFVTDANGSSPIVLDVPVVVSELVGVEFVAQGMVNDPLGQGGTAFTAGRRFSFGFVDGSPLLPLPASLGGEFLRVFEVADFDEDGVLDLVTIDQADGKAIILLGRGDGSFDPVGTYASSGPFNFDVAVADLDLDGRLDFVTPSSSLSAAFVHLGDGRGGFTGLPPTPMGGASVSVDVADFNGDGIPDLAFSNIGLGTVSVAIGNGDGTFGLPFATLLSVGGGVLAVGDADGDGDPDLAVGSGSPNSIEILLNDGAGSFSSALLISTSNRPDSVEWLDLDSDGDLDLISGQSAIAIVSVWMNDGAGGFSPRIDSTVGRIPIELADMNGDGVVDVLAGEGSGDRLGVSFGDGSGSFAEPILFELPLEWLTFAVADVDGDGAQDVIVGGEAPPTSGGAGISVLLGTDDGTLLRDLDPLPELPDLALAGSAADLDGDGHDELVVALDDLNTLVVLKGDAANGFTTLSTTLLGIECAKLMLADVSQDGVVDAIVSSTRDDAVVVALGLGDGTFATPFVVAAVDDIAGVDIGDLDGDGLSDIVVGTSGPSTIRFYRGTGAGAFELADEWPTPEVAGDIALVALGTSSSQQIVTLNHLSETLQVWRLSGAGIVPIATYSVPDDSAWLDAVDLDLDGDVDLVVRVRSRVVVFRNSGAGGLTQTMNAPFAYGWSRLATLDLDGDAVLDLVGVTSTESGLESGVLVVQLLNADLTPRERRRYAAGTSGLDLPTGDFDGDGFTDVIIVGGSERSGTVALGLLLR